MPAYVDHQKRRRQVADVLATLIATRGLEAVTVRATAEATGFSTRVVSHYFKGKRELLLYCFRHIARRSKARLMAGAHKSPGDVRAAINLVLPYNEQAREDWLVWVSFWGLAVADAEFSVVQKQQFSTSRKWLVDLVTIADQQNRLQEEEREIAASELLSSLIGVSVQAAFNPDEWPQSRQEDIMARMIARCLKIE